jgi:hypothetical protein
VGAGFLRESLLLKLALWKKDMTKKSQADLSNTSTQITQLIVWIRNQKVMLDDDLARLYGAQTKVLVQAVKRNPERFPQDFLFQINDAEWDSLRSQFVTSKKGRGGRRYPPYAFTEQGVAMLSSVINSPQAIAVNIEIMRAFVNLRELISSNKELVQKLDTLDGKLKNHDAAIINILAAIRELMKPPALPKKRPIGFIHND